jgi:hypothetical protein
MSNPISAALRIGTLGELLVQIRLLQFDVQAAAPLKDSGNDLIAVRGTRFHTIQVKTTGGYDVPPWPKPQRIYSLLAVVRLAGEGTAVFLDSSDIFLVPQPNVAKLPRSWDALDQYLFTAEHVNTLFAPT